MLHPTRRPIVRGDAVHPDPTRHVASVSRFTRWPDGLQAQSRPRVSGTEEVLDTTTVANQPVCDCVRNDGNRAGRGEPLPRQFYQLGVSPILTSQTSTGTGRPGHHHHCSQNGSSSITEVHQRGGILLVVPATWPESENCTVPGAPRCARRGAQRERTTPKEGRDARRGRRRGHGAQMAGRGTDIQARRVRRLTTTGSRNWAACVVGTGRHHERLNNQLRLGPGAEASVFFSGWEDVSLRPASTTSCRWQPTKMAGLSAEDGVVCSTMPSALPRAGLWILRQHVALQPADRPASAPSSSNGVTRCYRNRAW